MAVAGRVFPATKDELWRATVAQVYPLAFQAPPIGARGQIRTNAAQVYASDLARRLLSMKKWR